jgi:hypothetical protein
VIPDLVDIGGPWKVLPPGVHDATFSEVKSRFATNEKRESMYEGLLRGCRSLESAGCAVVYLDGSYVTEKPTPGDFDVCWDPNAVDPSKLDPVLLDFGDRRRNQRQKYGGEFFPSSARADGSRTFVEFFRTDRDTGKEKGVIRIRLQ